MPTSSSSGIKKRSLNPDLVAVGWSRTVDRDNEVLSRKGADFGNNSNIELTQPCNMESSA